MRVLLVGAELEENLALRYLGGALEAEGHSVAQVDFNNVRGLEAAAGQIARSGAHVVGFSMVFTHRAREFARLVSRCRELGFGGLTVAGGHFAAFHAEQLLTDVPALDAVAIGEGESILCSLARAPDEPGGVPGLVWRDRGTIRRNAAAEPQQDLEGLARPTRRRPFGSYLGLPIVNMLGSRGCTYACAFCSISAWHELCGGARHRVRSPSAIAAEMACLWREGVRLFNFHDDNFLGRDRQQNLQRAAELRDELARQGVGKLGFQIKARPDAVDPELFALLRSMGLFRVFLGIEAGTDLSLKQLGRGQRLADNVKALEILNGLDLHVAFNLLVLNPDSTLEDFAGNVAFLREHISNPMNFCRTEIYAGTPLERRLRQQGRLRGDYWWLDYTIADERAQRAFELYDRAFHERNFGEHPLHYLSGQVDYEQQIRADFFGTTPELKAGAKRFVRTVNENTVLHLEEIITAIREGRADEGFAREIAAAVSRDDSRLHAEGEEILRWIEELRRGSRRARGRVRAALAASVTLAVIPCTMHCEAAPGSTATCETDPPKANYDFRATAHWAGPDAGTLVVYVDLSIFPHNMREGVVFTGTQPPTLTGGRLLHTASNFFEFLPDPGVMQSQAIVTIDCGAIPQQYLLTFDVTNPVAGNTVPVTVEYQTARDT